MPDVDRCRSACALSTGGVATGLLASTGIETFEEVGGRLGRVALRSEGGSMERVPRPRAGEAVVLGVVVVAFGLRVRLAGDLVGDLAGDLAGVLDCGGVGRGVSRVSRVSRAGVS